VEATLCSGGGAAGSPAVPRLDTKQFGLPKLIKAHRARKHFVSKQPSVEDYCHTDPRALEGQLAEEMKHLSHILFNKKDLQKSSLAPAHIPP